MTTDTASSPRSAGILLHPTSLPGPYGIGDLGPTSFAWVDTLARARQSWWQILPLNPSGYGNSPYSSYSAFAGNIFLISPDLLVQEGVLQPADIAHHGFANDHVDFDSISGYKLWVLDKAWQRFRGGAVPAMRSAYEAFCQSHASWLQDYALYMAIKQAQRGAAWLDWPEALRLRQPAALTVARKELADTIGLYTLGQFLFFRQLARLREHARRQNIKLIGDIPIFVSADSADVWANPELFLLDAKRRPKVVAGVPPDYFSATGQLWGNPLYDWEALRRTGYAWWIARFRATLEQVDLIRLDHFRGFESYWEVPAGSPTAQTGQWRKGPGAHFLEAVRKGLGGLPLIAEDLGIITDDVLKLREQFNLPGMRILHFAFVNDPEDRFLPHNYERNTAVYTGTHDNDTTWGWYHTLGERERAFLHRYVPHVGHDVPWELTRLAWSSVADYAIVPFQDVLGLGTDARMNYPGKADGNWGWRFTQPMVSDRAIDRLADITELYNRAPHQRKK